MRSHGVAWAKLRIFGRLPPFDGTKKARWQLIRRPTAPQSEGVMRKATAVDRRFRRGDSSPSSDLFSSRWTSLRPQRPTSRHFIVSANQRAFALTHRRKPGDSRYMDTAERRKRGGCVLSRAKVLILFRIDAVLRKKNFNTIEKQKTSPQNKWTFFRILPIFRPNHAPFREHPTFGGLPSSPPRFPTCTDTPERTRAHAHRALSEFSFLAFTLHLHPQHVDYQ